MIGPSLTLHLRRLLQFCLIAALAVWISSPLTAQTVLREGWKVQSSAQVSVSAEKISQPGFSTQGWYSTTAPKTVFAVLVENGVYKDPYYGANLRNFPGVEYKIGSQFANEEMPASSPYAVPWWYRKEFELPASDQGKQIWMQFRGINYRAEIWINGKRLAGSDEVVVFEPVGPEDEDAAAQETDYGNHVFMQQNAGFMVLYSFIKDALLSKVGVVKAWWEEREEEQRETYYDLTEDQFTLLARVGWRLGNRRPHGSRRQREPRRSGRKQNLVENSNHKPKFNHRMTPARIVRREHERG
jgi:hypothetical protein